MIQKPILPEGLRLTVQTVFPGKNAEGFDQFMKLLDTAQQLGLYGLELNLPDLEETIAPEELTRLLSERNLRLTYVASGLYAARRGLALASDDEVVRKKAVEGCLAHMRYAQAMGADCGVILGTIKGSPSLAPESGAKERLICSLQEVCARSRGLFSTVPVLLEATNHYEASAANTLSETLGILEAVGMDNLYVLPDTYHMNIEEKDAYGAVRAALPHMRNIHLSDNNRYFPGYGAVDFSRWYAFLQNIGYAGTFGIEGRTLHNPEEDLEESVRFLGEAL